MKELKKVCIVAEHYPYKGEPLFTFVQQLAYSLSNENVKCYVVAPQSITRALLGRGKKKPLRSIDVSPEGKKIEVLRPYILSFSNTSNKVLRWICDRLIRHAIRRGVKMIGKSVDCCYCYFWHVGLRTVEALKKENIPVFVQASECDITVSPEKKRKELLERVHGVVCASGKNRDESLAEGLTKLEDTIVVVNGYRKDQFYVQDKRRVREKMGIGQDKFVVGFVGGFIPRKGIRQLTHVLDRFDDVYSIFVGTGAEPPTCKNVLFSGKVQHEQIVDYLNCCDVFILPTSAEGCCNAIIEALACGLPVISSNKSFNDEILDDECSIRIDELNEEELYVALNRVKNDSELRGRMSDAALRKAEQLTIERRATQIKDYLSMRIS